MSKCEKCLKNITKRAPGVECSKCEKLVHSSTQCSGLISKQLTALRNSENLDWTCQECQSNSTKRGSLIIPDDEEEEVQININNAIDVKKLLKDIAVEVDKCVNRAVRDIQTALQFQSTKVDEVLDNQEAFKQTLQDLQRKNTDLSNRNKYLETKFGALEQTVIQLQQDKLTTCVEIANLPLTEKDDVATVVKKVASVCEQSHSDVVRIKKLPARKDSANTILVELKEEAVQEKWLSAAKTKNIFVADVISETTHATARQSVFVREALTPYNKKLLWTAKQELKHLFKFIWCKRGTILAKRNENDRAIIKIRTLEDIKNLLSS